MEFLEISEKFNHFSKFSGFCIFRAIDTPKPLINDKEYWCFHRFRESLRFSTSQKIAIGISKFTEISGSCKWSGNTNVSGEGFPARAEKIQNGILRNPPGAPNGAFLAVRAGIRKVLWKLLEISIFNPDRLGTSHFT